jgi:hypothetical protein
MQILLTFGRILETYMEEVIAMVTNENYNSHEKQH